MLSAKKARCTPTPADATRARLSGARVIPCATVLLTWGRRGGGIKGKGGGKQRKLQRPKEASKGVSRPIQGNTCRHHKGSAMVVQGMCVQKRAQPCERKHIHMPWHVRPPPASGRLNPIMSSHLCPRHQRQQQCARIRQVALARIHKRSGAWSQEKAWIGRYGAAVSGLTSAGQDCRIDGCIHCTFGTANNTTPRQV